MKKIFALATVLVIFTGCSQKPATPVQTQETQQMDQTSTMRIGKNLILVLDQKPGNSVHINQVIIEKNGYLSIHEDKNGGFGDIIGTSTLLPEGSSQNFDIILNKTMSNGQKFYAMLHADDGDGVFDPAKDLPLKDEQGNIMHGIFYVSTNAGEPGAISI